MPIDTTASGAPVALVIQRRVAEDGYAAFAAWEARVADRLRSWPGFIAHEVVPPAPPQHLDWVVVERFASAETARAWLGSDDRAALLAEIQSRLAGKEDLQLLSGADVPTREAASAIIIHDIAAEDERAFLKWQAEVQAAEAKFPGFLRHKIERPIAGLHDNWITILSFDNDAHLNAWLASPERTKLLERGARFTRGLSVQQSHYGFDFWFADARTSSASDRHVLMKNNLIVLAVLYPIVFLWNYFLGGPLLDAQGVPFWLSLFIGNLVSTQLLGWWAVPAAFERFGWWLAPNAGWRANLAGYAVMAAIFVLSMALYAVLLTWNLGRG